ncbi:hypothetical protein PIB30_101725, partial [Stylosanthes scabra]|nr:hypothetical protein [Stylosanthes scabra]
LHYQHHQALKKKPRQHMGHTTIAISFLTRLSPFILFSPVFCQSTAPPRSFAPSLSSTFLPLFVASSFVSRCVAFRRACLSNRAHHHSHLLS